MIEENVVEKLRQISIVVDDFSLETVKIAAVQADLCQVKKVNTMLEGKVDGLIQENTVLKDDLGTLKEENVVLKGEVDTMQAKVSTLGKQNTVLTNQVDTLRTDVDNIRLALVTKEVGSQCSNEQKSIDVGATNEPKSGNGSVTQCSNELKSINIGGANDSEPVNAKEEETVDRPLNVGTKKPKAQRKREQTEIFRNWSKTMAQRKTSQDLWGAGLLKVTIEHWEEEGIKMDEAQIFDFIQRNVDHFTPFISSENSKTRFFLTFIKICSMHQVSKQKFEEIMGCFVNKGSGCSISELDVSKFTDMYKE